MLVDAQVDAQRARPTGIIDRKAKSVGAGPTTGLTTSSAGQ
ncbi:hypothetical protein I545_5154 [Mycobacterium kansasii 662]|uniref:Uncharacterized protein n=1 Tax=Mycobacterium kansasii 662 TaxID=1299326 RepID=X7Z1J6_MYCKA|nr:hypothetical protein I545_5154 [Mycobacterium kansasii 662]